MSLYSYLLTLPKELLVDMLLKELRYANPNDSFATFRSGKFDGTNAVSIEIKLCRECHESAKSVCKCGEHYCYQCDWSDNINNLCRKCSLAGNNKMCAECNRLLPYWECTVCQINICRKCSSSARHASHLGSVRREI